MAMEVMRPDIQAAPSVKIMFNIGGTVDIPTGTFIEGRNKEYILNGGLAMCTGVTGIGNQFKSTIMHWMNLTGMSRVVNAYMNTYDTEVNIHEWHLAEMIRRIEGFRGEDILDTGRWVITDKSVYTGDEWYVKYRAFLEERIKKKDKLQVETPFWNRDRTGPFMMTQPTFVEVDSFSEFDTQDAISMQADNELGESGANTIHMRQGLQKMRFLMDVPRMFVGTNTYLSMSAHLGKESAMQSAGGGREIPVKTLEHLKNGDAIKGTTKKFSFLTHNLWHCANAKPLINDGTKAPEYPRSSDDNLRLDTDLSIVTLRNLRSKSGISGMTQQIIVSQTEGVLGSLTEFHHIKEMQRYGLEGSNISYNLVIYPDCKLGRTTVRGKIDSDYKLRTALRLTSELCQISYLFHDLDDVECKDINVLYKEIKDKGYDWDMILKYTRPWYHLDSDYPGLFLSSMDLLRMRAGKYHPYWLAEDKKTILPKYQKQADAWLEFVGA